MSIRKQSRAEFALRTLRKVRGRELKHLEMSCDRGSKWAAESAADAYRFAISLLDEDGPEAKEIDAELAQIGKRFKVSTDQPGDVVTVTTLNDLIAANDFPANALTILKTLEVGQTFHCGGGAAPIFAMERIA